MECGIGAIFRKALLDPYDRKERARQRREEIDRWDILSQFRIVNRPGITRQPHPLLEWYRRQTRHEMGVQKESEGCYRFFDTKPGPLRFVTDCLISYVHVDK